MLARRICWPDLTSDPLWLTSSNWIGESESEQTVQDPYVRILINAIGDVVLAFLEVFVTELSPAEWEWRVCDHYGTTIMRGFESTRPAARHKRALFLLLAVIAPSGSSS